MPLPMQAQPVHDDPFATGDSTLQRSDSAAPLAIADISRSRTGGPDGRGPASAMLTYLAVVALWLVLYLLELLHLFYSRGDEY